MTMGERETKAAERCQTLYRFDAEHRQSAAFLCGVDEAGRGPLCGPVSVGAVVLNPDDPVPGIDDSKRLSEKKRDTLYEIIIQKAVAWKVILVAPEDIDRMNILGATLHGMQLAVEQLGLVPDLVLIDGNCCPPLAVPTRAVTKGDATSACIAAASILAKVTRDRFMEALDREYPQYKLAQHKGYPTKLHYELLAQHGIQPFYRRSFLKKQGY